MRVRYKTFKTIKLPLATDETAVKGKLAAVKASDGLAYDGDTAATTLLPIGHFAEALATGDGTTEVLIDLFEEVRCDGWLNDTDPHDVDTLFSMCYIKDGQTVSTSSAGSTRSYAGRVIAIENSLIYVMAGLKAVGATGAAGAAGADGADGVVVVATKAALAALTTPSDDDVRMVAADRSMWRFEASSTATEDEAQDLVITADDATPGNWLAVDKFKVIKAPITYEDADGAAIFTVPAGFVLRLAAFPYWNIVDNFSGGAGSTIGISTSITGYETGGDLLGGAAGDNAATLVPGLVAGTLGGELDDHIGFQALVIQEGDEIQYDRITDAFSAGTGYACIPVSIEVVAE